MEGWPEDWGYGFGYFRMLALLQIEWERMRAEGLLVRHMDPTRIYYGSEMRSVTDSIDVEPQ